MARVPPIKAVMSPFPYSIAAGASLAEARWMLSAHGIRHLPVLDGENLVGVLSSRDIDRAMRSSPDDDGAPTVGQACSSPAYTVELETPLDNVLLHMVAERIGSALVVRGDKVVGIFTTTDACRLFAEMLRRDLPPSGNDAA